MKNNKKVQINEDALVELIYNITERTIAERIEKGELAKVEKPKIPVVSILTRNHGDAKKIANAFYLQFPIYKFVTFKELRGMAKREFAEELGKSCLSVWIDDPSGFGTFPLEAMQSGTPVIATCFGGANEAVLNRITGLVINPFNTDIFLKNNFPPYKAIPGLTISK